MKNFDVLPTAGIQPRQVSKIKIDVSFLSVKKKGMIQNEAVEKLMNANKEEENKTEKGTKRKNVK